VPDLRPAVVFDIGVYVEAVAGASSDWPLLAAVPPKTANAAADCLSIAFDADDFRLVASPHILANVARVLRRLGVSEATAVEACGAVLELVEMTGGAVLEPPRRVFDVADHEDNLIMDLAVLADAVLVVSEDTDLTQLSPWHGRIPILRPREFVERMVNARRGR
jgi:predicted nucleic acid-binding protein